MLLIAIANGAARDLWYKKHLGDLRAHQVSTVTFLIFLGVYIRFIISRFPLLSGTQAILTGLLWVLLTLLFEFGFGLLRGNSFPHLLEDYNILKGRLWILIPAWLLLAPYLFYRISG
jgi:hypothetical protein